MNAVCKWNYSLRDGGFSPDLYAQLGVPDLCAKLPADVLAVGDAVGPVLPDVLAATGLAGRPVVAEGGIDAHLSLLSTGALHSGDVSLVAGTSAAHVSEIAAPVFTPTIWGPYPDALLEGRWLVEGGQVSAGSILRWVAERMLCRPQDEASRLIADASAVPAGSHGILVLDYFMGNRTPYRDAQLRGAVLGLTLASTAEEVYRAAVESVAYGTRNVLDSFVQAGIPVPGVTVSGGIAHNPLWLQTTADVLGAPLKLVASENLTLRAGAACASAAAGLRADLRSASEAFTASFELVEPNTDVSAVYADGFGRYLAATEALAPVSHELARAADGG
jgi:ribulose kinase